MKTLLLNSCLHIKFLKEILIQQLQQRQFTCVELKLIIQQLSDHYKHIQWTDKTALAKINLKKF